MNSSKSSNGRSVHKLRHYRKILTFLQFLSDFISIVFSFGFAYALWNYLGPILAVDMYEEVHFSRYNLLYGVSLLTLLIGFEVYKLYRSQRSLFNIQEFQLILKTWGIACGATMMILYLADELYFSRGLFALTWGSVLVTLFIERYVFFKFNAFLVRMGFVDSTVLIYGTGALARKLQGKLRQSPKLGYQVAGFIQDNEEGEGPTFPPKPVLGSFSNLKNIIETTGAEKLFIAHPQISSEKVADILKICYQTNCQFQITPSVYETALERTRIHDMEGVPLVSIQEPSLNILQRIIKRTFDILIGSILLTMLFPIFLAAICLLKIFRLNPVVERHERTGREGSPFTFYCFLGTYKGKVPRKHRLLNGLKHLGIHKYPLLTNVLSGDMSLIGPKPQPPSLTSQYSHVQQHKLNVRPGWTGLWDLAANDTTATENDLDIYYIQNQTLLLDLAILLRVFIRSTFKAIQYTTKHLWKQITSIF